MWTETEAGSKWCPLARQLVTINDGSKSPLAVGSANRFDGPSGSFCCASACMAWRWELTKKPLANPAAHGSAIGLASALQPIIYERGYCGAFGQSSGRPPSPREGAV